MTTDKSITKAAPAGLATTPTDARLDAAVAESLVIRGDVSGLKPDQRVALYLATCKELGLNPRAQPFSFLRLNGKEVMYATRGATDQLARLHNVTREVIDGPKVIDLAGTKMVYCAARATLPGGRSETSVATLPLVDPLTVLMKAETKAKRRATIALLGLSVLDEDEVRDIPASAKGATSTPSADELAAPIVVAPPLMPANPINALGIEHPQRAPRREVTHAIDPRTGAVVQGDDTERLTPADDPERAAIQQEAAPDDGPVIDGVSYAERLGQIELPGEAVVVWRKYRGALAALPSFEREAAWKALCKRVEEVGKMKQAKVWLKKAIAEEDARSAAEVSA